MSKKKKKDTEYLYITTNLRSREPKMLTREKMERMIDAASFDEAAKLLEESGYQDMSGMKAFEIEQVLASHREAVFNEITRHSPEPCIVDAFRLKYDYHNAKVLVKAEGSGVSGDRILSKAGRVDIGKLTEAFNEEAYAYLPPALAAAMAEARGVLARTGNPQLSDFVLDKANYSEMLSVAAELKSPFLIDYAKLLIDSSNLRAAVRTLRMGKDADFLRAALINGGTVDADRVILSAYSGDGLASLYVASPLSEAAQASMDAVAGQSLTSFEMLCDNAVTGFLGRAKLVSFGEDPVIAYLAALENEITTARMILTGRLAGIAPDKLRERLRDSYA